MGEALSPRDELIQYLSEFVRDQYKQSHTAVNGAQLDAAIRFHFGPGFSYQKFGLDKLVKAVALAQDAGHVVRNPNVKHLEVLPATAMGAVLLHRPLSQPRPPLARKAFLRKEIWHALLYASHCENHYLKRADAEVVLVPSEQTQQYDADSAYVKLKPVSPTVQKTWMRNFVAGKPFPDAASAPIDAIDWSGAFSGWLQEHGDEVVRDWRAYRTRQVLAYASQWARANDVAEHLLWSQSHTRPAISTTGSSSASDSVVAAPKDEQNADPRRRAILAALNEMSTEELIQLPIPLRYLLRHFEPS